MTVDQVVLLRFPAKMRVDILPQPGANAIFTMGISSGKRR
jgi:hypothetical protein